VGLFLDVKKPAQGGLLILCNANIVVYSGHGIFRIQIMETAGFGCGRLFVGLL
jgi:hypothetical protein